jgi:hypothetical protein
MLLILTASLIAVSMAGPTTAHSDNLRVECSGVLPAINFYKTSTWKWQDEFALPHSKVSKQKVQSCKYGKWVAKVWRARAWKWRKQYHTLEIANRDFNRSAAIAHQVFRDISPERLWNRANVEGGHGAWYCNHYGSHACGWFQFMSGTYYGRSDEAFLAARKRGFPIPQKYNSWYSVLGQNITAAYMFHIGLECSREGWAASC